MEIYEQLVDISTQVENSSNDIANESHLQAAAIIMRYSKETEQVLDVVIGEIRERIRDSGNTLMGEWFESVILTICEHFKEHP